MQRQLKFRCWDKANKEFREDFVIGSAGEIFLIDDREYYEGRENTYILTQYTGLKDSTGKEIYEGDIIEFHIPSLIEVSKLLGEIKFRDGIFGTEENRIKINGISVIIPLRDTIEKIYPGWFYIIGNIFENSELLKKGK